MVRGGSITVLEHVEDTLDGEEAVRLLLLAEAVEEDGEVVMVVQLLDVQLGTREGGRERREGL